MADPIRKTLEALAAGDVLARLEKLERAQKAQASTPAPTETTTTAAPVRPRHAGPPVTHKT